MPGESGEQSPRRCRRPLRTVAGIGRAMVVGIPFAAAIACGPRAGDTVGADATAVEHDAVIRLTGTVEAVQTTTVSVPRLQGPMVPLLVVGLVKAGTRVEPGDPIVEFDRQQQQRDAFDRRAELVNIEGEIARKRAEQKALEAKDLTELKAAEHDVARAELDVRSNDLIAGIEAEKNRLALEQASARFAQLQKTFDLTRQAAAADLEILEIRRARAERALRYAESNARLMVVRAPFSGLAVIKRVYRNGQFVEIAEGDEVRPGLPVVDIVDTARMRVRAKVNQADVDHVAEGTRVKVGLDGFPELMFEGTVQLVTPLASASQLTETVRTFTVLIDIEGTHAQLLPDLTAWVDVPPAGTQAASRSVVR
jgi:HlyD family secretion protein|nr:MAG: hypothetical protein DIU54_06710 [Acidobacteriota bacterium]